jgi:PhnB protein
VESVRPPEGYHSVNAYLVVDGVERLIAFLTEVFGATEEGERERTADGRIDHAEVRIGDSVVMLSGASEAYPPRPSVLFVYGDDVDAIHRAAVAAGAKSILTPTNQPWGDRVGGFHDPFDNRWWVATRQDAGSVDGPTGDA